MKNIHLSKLCHTEKENHKNEICPVNQINDSILLFEADPTILRIKHTYFFTENSCSQNI
jgi:hypothetical protein